MPPKPHRVLLDRVDLAFGHLPLLEQALHTLWQRRTEGFLTHEAYHAIGELPGTLPQLAEAAFTQLSTEEQSLARHVLMQLVQVGDTSLGIGDTRQRRFLAELSPSAFVKTDLSLSVIDRDFVRLRPFRCRPLEQIEGTVESVANRLQAAVALQIQI